jgi:hypothetical protein
MRILRIIYKESLMKILLTLAIAFMPIAAWAQAQGQVPEPETIVLLGIGALAFLLARKKLK